MSDHATVEAGATLTLAAGSTLNNPYGRTLTVEGAFTADGDLTGTGALVVQNGGQAHVNGAFGWTSASVSGDLSVLAFSDTTVAANLAAGTGATLDLTNCVLTGSQVVYDDGCAGGLVDGCSGTAHVDVYAGDVTVTGSTLPWVAIYGGS